MTYQYLQNKDVHWCPTATGTQNQAAFGDTCSSTVYGYNCAYLSYIKLTKIAHPDATIMNAETTSTGWPNPPARPGGCYRAAIACPGCGSGGIQNALVLRHNMGTNLAWVDGHVTYVKGSGYRALENWDRN
jgi:prepilin-type processing-associated H-X9-DG protein